MEERLITIQIITKASKEEIIDFGGDSFKVKLHAPPIKGQANKRLVELLASYFGVSKSQVDIIKGLKSKHKLVFLKK